MISHLLLKAFLISAVFIVSACATKAPLQEAERLAARQTAHIRQHLPLQSGPYTWVQVQNKGTVIYITLLNKNVSAATLQADAFSVHFPQEMCEQPAVQALLDKGVTYRVTVNLQGSNAQQLILNAQTCRAVQS